MLREIDEARRRYAEEHPEEIAAKIDEATANVKKEEALRWEI